MQRVPVQSTTLRSVGYDPATRTLEAEFTTGRIYAYSDVPPQLWLSLLATKSKGKFFNILIRDRFRYHSIREPDGPHPRPANR
jgi:hypothetical protein